MLSIGCDSRFKSWRNKKRSTKNIKNCEGINYPSEKDEWKKIESNNLTIALNALYIKKMDICPVYVSKHNSKRKNKLPL